jgi:cytochrome c553
MKIKTARGLAIAACIGLLAVGRVAQAEGDAEEGKRKFYTCLGCHGIVGQSNSYPAYHVPRLGGQDAAYVISALKAYRDGSRKHGSMEGNSLTLSDKDLQDLAAYISRFRLVSEDNAITGNADAGKSKAAACGACHGEDGNSESPGNPKLARQYETYLIKVLNEYKAGTRKNAIMNGMAASLSEQDIKDLSAYYASQKKGVRVMSDD